MTSGNECHPEYDERACRGRDIFVDGPQTPAQVGQLFGEVLGVGARGIVLEDASAQHQREAWSERRRIEVYQLESGSDFAFKLSIDLDTPIDVDRFSDLAQNRRLKIAWSVNERAAHDHDYYVAFPDGSIAIYPLSFRETTESYACIMLPSDLVEPAGSTIGKGLAQNR
ncbi:hypothetical protein [Agrobacterium sp. lyk4-40-TYG-31]|uniref:hypothetical protein n=1 Tax=Agrobacterium sp. lyk4-40-TYG-31 TaxID=3040276 RepID=UPI0013AFAF60|nr:hypothetical protein [Agrobacterium sp. lyk4-40-TYG-31]